MSEAARREAWQHTAWLSAMIANANRDSKKKPSPFQPDDFNPMAARDKKADAIVVDESTIGDLKSMFVGDWIQDQQGPEGPERQM